MRPLPPTAHFLFLLAAAAPTRALAVPSTSSPPNETPPLENLLHDLSLWIQDHPGETACILTGASLTGGALVIPPILGTIGFGAGGVGAATLAASTQSSIGPIAAGSAFAWAQSVGAGGAATGALQLVGGLGVVVSGTGAVTAVARDNGWAGWLERAHKGVAEDVNRLWVQAGPVVEHAGENIGRHMNTFGENVGVQVEGTWRDTAPARQEAEKHVKQALDGAGAALQGVAHDVEGAWLNTAPARKDAEKHVKQALGDAGMLLQGVALDAEEARKKVWALFGAGDG